MFSTSIHFSSVQLRRMYPLMPARHSLHRSLSSLSTVTNNKSSLSLLLAYEQLTNAVCLSPPHDNPSLFRSCHEYGVLSFGNEVNGTFEGVTSDVLLQLLSINTTPQFPPSGTRSCSMDRASVSAISTSNTPHNWAPDLVRCTGLRLPKLPLSQSSNPNFYLRQAPVLIQ